MRSSATIPPNSLRTPRTWMAASGMLEPAVPAQQGMVDPGHHRVDGEADHADGDHAGEYLVAPEVFARLEDPVPEAAVDGDHLRHDHHDERHPDADPHPGEDRRHRSGEEHAPEEGPRRSAEVLRRAHVDGVHRAHARDGVHQHREEGAQRDEEEGGRVPQAEPEDGERDEGDGRDRTKQLHDRVEQLVDAVARAHPKAERKREARADGKSDEDPQERRHRVARQLAGDQVIPPLARHLGGRREDRRAHVRGAADDFPDGERGGDHRDGAQRPHLTTAARLASCSRSSLTNSSALGVRDIFPTPYFVIRSAVICTCSAVMSYVKAALPIASLYSSAVSAPRNIFSRTYFSASSGLSMNSFVASTKHFIVRSATLRLP